MSKYLLKISPVERFLRERQLKEEQEKQERKQDSGRKRTAIQYEMSDYDIQKTSSVCAHPKQKCYKCNKKIAVREPECCEVTYKWYQTKWVKCTCSSECFELADELIVEEVKKRLKTKKYEAKRQKIGDSLLKKNWQERCNMFKYKCDIEIITQ